MSKNQQKQSFNSAENLRDSATKTLAPIAGSFGSNYQPNIDAGVSSLKGAGDIDTGMATTGGFTDADKTAYLNRSASTADAAGNVEQNAAKLAGARTGQGNPQAAISRISRQIAQQKSQNVNDAQAGLTSQINANKLQGAGQLAGVGQAQANIGNQSAQQQMAALGLQFGTEAEAQAYMDQIANSQKGPLANAEQLYSTAIGRG